MLYVRIYGTYAEIAPDIIAGGLYYDAQTDLLTFCFIAFNEGGGIGLTIGIFCSFHHLFSGILSIGHLQ